VIPAKASDATWEKPPFRSENPCICGIFTTGSEAGPFRHYGVVTLFWRAFATNTAVILGATVALAATPGDVRFPRSLMEAAVGAVVLASILGTNLVLLRPLFEPLQRLASLMRQIDLLHPGQRLGVAGKGEIAVLGATFNEMLARLEAQRQESVTVTLTAQEEERRRIARNLHDEIGQTLTAVLLQLDRLGKRVQPELSSELDETVETVRGSLEEVRRMARELRPGVLDDFGLVHALLELSTVLAARVGLRIERRIAPSLPSLSPETELVIYRVAQESLTNVARHSGAGRVELRLERVPGGVVLRISDDGCGIDGAEVVTSLGGLRGMREWALLVGGELDVSPRRPRGVQVRLRVRALDDQEQAA
jgi:two-component system, NarL family, sensor histidine kinase UhpB